MLVDFCLPVKNEADVLENNTLRLFTYLHNLNLAYKWRIVILVNGSNDQSLVIARKIFQKDRSHFIYKNIKNSGKGGAIKEYFIKSDADILVFMDIDLSVNLENIPKLLEPVLEKSRDIVISSRLLRGATTNRSSFREYNSRLYNFFSRFLLNHHFRDLQCGFKVCTKEVFQKVYPWLRDSAWFFDTEFVIIAKRLGYNIQEVAVDWKENRYFKRKTKTSLINGWLFFYKSLFFWQRLKKINLRGRY